MFPITFKADVNDLLFMLTTALGLAVDETDQLFINEVIKEFGNHTEVRVVLDEDVVHYYIARPRAEEDLIKIFCSAFSGSDVTIVVTPLMDGDTPVYLEMGLEKHRPARVLSHAEAVQQELAAAFSGEKSVAEVVALADIPEVSAFIDRFNQGKPSVDEAAPETPPKSDAEEKRKNEVFSIKSDGGTNWGKVAAYTAGAVAVAGIGYLAWKHFSGNDNLG